MWWLLEKQVGNKNTNTKGGVAMRAEALDLRFGLAPRASLGDIGFVLLSASAFPKLASVEEAQRMSWSVW